MSFSNKIFNTALNREEKFAAEVGIGFTDDFASVVSPSAQKADIAMMVEYPEDFYVMQVFIPKRYDAVKIDCRDSELYPTKRTITPRYTHYQQAKNDIRKDVKAAISGVSFDMLRTSTVKDGGKNIDRYEIDFLLAPSNDYVNIGELPLLITLVDPDNAERKYDEIDYKIMTANGNTEITKNGEIFRKPKF